MQSYKETLQNKFTEAYNQLNQQQRIAVDTIEGPVMVIAGPGTGKTQILAARIGKILLDTDALPENILCLTYTDAGAIAMRRRLQQFIGADAYKVNIYTFHAFCNDVIQDNLSLFEKNTLDAVSELESIELFKSLIDNFKKEHPLKRYRGDVYFEINNLRGLFSTMKREGWTPTFTNERIDDYIKDLPLRDEFIYKRKYKQFNPGDLKQDKIDEEIERAEKLRAAVNEFDNFQQLMRLKNRYDFDDMINWVIRAFQENAGLLSDYQERYQYILIDEFQDTSGTQNKLVELLINYWDEPNVFVVGDDDQSIFRFQGANVENMISFKNQYEASIKTVVLTNNYRSTQPILDISKTLIAKNEERLIGKMPGLSKDLISSRESLKALQHLPAVTEYNSVKEEMAGITNQVEALLTQGIAPGKIAIIYRENRYGEEIGNYLRLKKIPVYSKRSFNILLHPFVNKLITLLRYLDAEHDIPYGGDKLLFEILHYDFYSIPPIEIARLTVDANKRNYNSEQTSIRKLLYDKANAPAKDLFDTGININLKNFSAAIEQLIADVSNLPLQKLFENIIRKGGILTYIMESPEKLVFMQLLTKLFDFIKDETARNPFLSLEALIKIINLMEKEEIKLPLSQVSGSEKGVNLLTAHGSKGLEFEYVFCAGINASSWEKKKNPFKGYKIPDTMFSSLAKGSEEEELRRLFYVALTRAEKHLHISYAKFKNDGKEIEPSMFLAEILGGHDLQVEKVTLTDAEMMIFQELQFTAQAPEIEKTEEEFITALLEKFTMNVTALSSYLDCPLGFYYKNLIRIPAGKSETLEFGSAIHHALEKLFTKMLADDNKGFPSSKEMVADFSTYLRKHRENFTQEEFDRRMEQGAIVLPQYYETYLHTWNKVVAIERNITGVLVNGVPLKGKLDKLEFNGKEINVVDYKSGNVDNALPKMKGPSDKDPNGGDYWRQAVFYKILIDNYSQKDWRVISTEFDFVEPDKKKEYRKVKIIISPPDTETVKQQITEVWNKIQNRDFYTGCGKEECHWCNFVKDNKLAVALHDLAEEE